MSVKLRMKKVGRKNRPEFRLVATDTHSPRDGRIIENLGFYHPLEKDAAKGLRFDLERVKYWLSVGAQPSETVLSILKKSSIVVPWVENEKAKTAKKHAERRQKKGKAPRAKKPGGGKPKAAAPAAAGAAPAATAAAPTTSTEEKAAAAASKAAKREAKKAGH